MFTAISESQTYVMAGEVASLKHEVRNHPVKCRAFISKALLASAQGTEILRGLGDNFVVELEVNTAGLLYVDS